MSTVETHCGHFLWYTINMIIETKYDIGANLFYTRNWENKIEGNRLILDNYLLTEFKNKWRDQEVEIYLYLPMGTLLKPDSSIQDYDDSDDSYFNLHFSSDQYIYKVEAEKVKCLNCPPEENNFAASIYIHPTTRSNGA